MLPTSRETTSCCQLLSRQSATRPLSAGSEHKSYRKLEWTRKSTPRSHFWHSGGAENFDSLLQECAAAPKSHFCDPLSGFAMLNLCISYLILWKSVLQLLDSSVSYFWWGSSGCPRSPRSLRMESSLPVWTTWQPFGLQFSFLLKSSKLFCKWRLRNNETKQT